MRTLITAVLALTGAALAGDEKSSAPAPATVENRVKEADLTVIKLTPEAEKRLGIELASVSLEAIERSVLRPGTVEVPIGRSLTLRAPIASRVTGVRSSSFTLAKGDVLLRLEPGRAHESGSFVPADRIQTAKALADLAAGKATAEGDLAGANARIQAATLAVKRAELLAQQGPGSQKALEEARGELAIASAASRAAELRIAVYSRVLGTLEASQSTAIEIRAPFSGVLQSIHVADEQIVESGAPLLELVATDALWIRVPIYVGELERLGTVQPSGLEAITGGAKFESVALKVVAAPPRASSASVTVDRVFEATNTDGALVPGLRVAVRFPTASDDRSLVVPLAAIVYDIQGGAWAYENVAPNQFARRRFEFREIVGNKAIVARGLRDGMRVVTAGAAELFGTEFGAGK